MKMLVKMLVKVVLVGALIGLPAHVLSAGEDHPQEGQRPDDGPTRLFRLFPDQGLDHLPGQAWERGAPHVLENVQKDARDTKSGNGK